MYFSFFRKIHVFASMIYVQNVKSLSALQGKLGVFCEKIFYNRSTNIAAFLALQ